MYTNFLHFFAFGDADRLRKLIAFYKIDLVLKRLLFKDIGSYDGEGKVSNNFGLGLTLFILATCDNELSMFYSQSIN